MTKEVQINVFFTYSEKDNFKFKMMNQLYFFKKLLTNLNQLTIKNY